MMWGKKKDKKIKCSRCGRKFRTIAKLEKHIRKMHRGAGGGRG